MNPFSDLAYFVRLRRLLKEEQPDMVFSYNIKPVIYASLAARFAGVDKIYALIPGLGFLFAPNPSMAKKILQRLIFPLYRLSLKRVGVLFFQNPDDLATFEDLKLISPSTRVVRVHGSGVGLGEFEFAKPVLSPVRFLFIGRLIRDKGLPEFVEAARHLRSRYGNRVEFNILGPLDTNPAAVKQSQLDEWEREGIINYLGVASDVRPHIRNASVFVLPSFYMEGVPRTILESLSMGRPIVTCNSRGCKETVSDGKNGYLVEPRDTDMLAKCLSRFVESPNLIELMGVESRRIAERDYDVVKVTNQMLDAMNMKTF
jgi:glycosyltransferase involved in cell wall biosynthesis